MESGYDEVSLLGINYCGWFVTPSRWLESSRNTDEHSKMMLHLFSPAFPQHPPVKSSLSWCLKASKGVRLQKFSYLRLLFSPCLTKFSQPVITMYYLLSECFPGHLWAVNSFLMLYVFSCKSHCWWKQGCQYPLLKGVQPPILILHLIYSHRFQDNTKNSKKGIEKCKARAGASIIINDHWILLKTGSPTISIWPLFTFHRIGKLYFPVSPMDSSHSLPLPSFQPNLRRHHHIIVTFATAPSFHNANSSLQNYLSSYSWYWSSGIG